MLPIKRLLVVSHVVHYRHNDRLYAYGPYAREIDIWADLFQELVIASPCRDEEPPGDCLPFTRPQITIDPMPETGGHSVTAKLKQLVMLPLMVLRLCRSMWKADAIHVRGPGNLGLLGTLFAPIFSRYRVAKWAGQWNGFENERFILWLQRALLRSRWWNAPVTVYGKWPEQPAHVHAFFTSMMTADQVEVAKQVASKKRIELPLRVLFSGRLAPEKRISALLDAAQLAVAQGVPLELTVVGDGPERDRLEQQTRELGLKDIVSFQGAVSFDENLSWYQWANCLVLPSKHSEGWPKVIAEAMCHGLICIAVEHGQLPAMLKERGILLPNGTPEELADALNQIASDPDRFSPQMVAASTWACQYSLEGLRDAIETLLKEQWLKGDRLDSSRSLDASGIS